MPDRDETALEKAQTLVPPAIDGGRCVGLLGPGGFMPAFDEGPLQRRLFRGELPVTGPAMDVCAALAE